MRPRVGNCPRNLLPKLHFDHLRVIASHVHYGTDGTAHLVSSVCIVHLPEIIGGMKYDPLHAMRVLRPTPPLSGESFLWGGRCGRSPPRQSRLSRASSRVTTQMSMRPITSLPLQSWPLSVFAISLYGLLTRILKIIGFVDKLIQSQ